MRSKWLSIFAAMTLTVASCGGGDEKSDADKDAPKASGSESEPSVVDLPECPVGADEGKEVTVKLWHSFQRANDEGIQELVKRFEAANPTINIELTQFNDYDDTTAKFRAGLEGNGDLPDAIHLEDKVLQIVADFDAVLPMQACADADEFDVSQLNERSVDFLTIDNVMYGMPFNLSSPVLYYDKSDFVKANLDPEKPPTTLDEVIEAAKALKAAGIDQPLAYESDSWYFEQWRALSNKLFVNEDNGRSGRSTEVAFDDEEGLAVFEWLATLHDEELAQGYPLEGIEHLLAIGNGQASMTLDSSTVLGTALQLLNGTTLADKELQLGVGALPSIGERSGGVSVGGGNMYLLKDADPAKQAAFYRFLKFATSAEQQAYWSVQTGYIPVNNDSKNDPALIAAHEATPAYKIAPSQLEASPAGPATAGPALGAYPEVRDAITNGMLKVLNEGANPKDVLAEIVEKSNAAIADYNERLGL